MRARIKPQPIQDAEAQKAKLQQALTNHKAATLEVIVSQVPETSTFASLGQLAGGYSSEWVRTKLIKAPERLFRVGRMYLIPRGLAVEFIRTVFQ